MKAKHHVLSCLHDLTALGPGGLAALAFSLFLVGLAGGFAHCATMCGPFVLAQADSARANGICLRNLQQAPVALLLPYHLGRLLGYSVLGAIAGFSGSLLVLAANFRLPFALLLLLAAFLLAAQAVPALGRIRLFRLGGVPQALSARIKGLIGTPGVLRGVLLGVMLSALPCGMIYGALAAAGASGSALAGAISMAAFALGTVPALILLAIIGRFFGRQAGPLAEKLRPFLFGLNAVILTGLAVRIMLGG